MIDSELALLSSGSPSAVAKARKVKLEQVKNFLNQHGFPKNKKEKRQLSLEPYYFQEAIYDDLDTMSKTGELGQLKNVYDIDLAVQTGGARREDVSDAQFASYVKERSLGMDFLLGRVSILTRIINAVLPSRVRG